MSHATHMTPLRPALLALVLLVAGAGVALARSLYNEGEVVGSVTNGTPGGRVPEALTVTLHTFSGTRETDTYTTTVGADGQFRLQKPDLQDGETAVVRAVYEGVTYLSDFFTVGDEEERVISLPVKIYETTTDMTHIQIVQLHVLVDQIGDRAQLRQVAILRNGGNRTYVGREAGGVRTTWSVVLPDKMEDLRFEHGEPDRRFIRFGRGFADSRPIPPGDGSVECAFSYELPLGDEIQVEQIVDVPIQASIVVLPGDGWKLRSDRLDEQGPLDTEAGRFVSYAGGPWDPGEPLVFAVSTEERAHAGLPDTGPFWNIIIGVAAVLVAAAAVFAMWRGPGPGRVPSQVREEIEALAALERAYAAKQLSSECYRERHEALKEEVRRKLSSGQRQHHR